MKIVTRTALMFTLFCGLLLYLFSWSIYFWSEKNREEEFVDRLRYKLIWRAEFILDAQLNESLLRKIHEQNKTLINEAQISVFDENMNLLFADLGEPEFDKRILSDVDVQKIKTWEEGEESYMALEYIFKEQPYYFVGHAFDETGFAHINQLRHLLITVYLIAIVIIFFASFLFSHYTLQPLKYIINNIKDVSEQTLNKALYVPQAKDELYELVQAFNGTFTRLEKAFNNQQQFVTVISHEFRTPLSSMIAELELAKQLNTTVDDYQKSIDMALKDAKEASALSSELLDFARSNYDSSRVSFTEWRLDEIVMDVKMDVEAKAPEYEVRISFGDDSEMDIKVMEEPLVYGNGYLLQVAFRNLIENACKYAEDGVCTVRLSVEDDAVIAQFSNIGVGIREEDLPHIYDLFFRSSNHTGRVGYGIGLAIVKRIVEMHDAEISVVSEPSMMTTFTVRFRRFEREL